MHCALYLAASDMHFIDSNSKYSLLVEIRTGHSMTLRPFALAASTVALGVIILIFLGVNEALFFQIPTGHSMTLRPFALAAGAVALENTNMQPFWTTKQYIDPAVVAPKQSTRRFVTLINRLKKGPREVAHQHGSDRT